MDSERHGIPSKATPLLLILIVDPVVDFVLVLFFAFGVAFEVPIATVILVWSGLTTVEALKKNRAYVFLGAFVIGMLVTPPDIISQTLLAVPVYLLYECGILLARILSKPKESLEENE